MKGKMKIQFSGKRMYFLFLLIPFFLPRGFLDISDIYRKISIVWLLISAILITGKFIVDSLSQKIQAKKSVVALLLYYVVFVLITLFTQKGILDGYQKLFISPILVMFIAMYFEDFKEEILSVISTILLLILSLNVVVFNPFFYSKYFSFGGLTFLGHMQIVPQVCLFSIFIAIVNDSLKRDIQSVRKIGAIFVFSFASLLFAKTSLALLIMALLIFAFLSSKTGVFKKVFLMNSQVYWVCWIIVNVTIVFYSVNFDEIRNFLEASSVFLNFDFSFSGRAFIWREAVELIKESVFIGFGAYGKNIVVFWHEWLNNGIGMNYAHNEFLQQLLDGGIILLFFYLCAVMLCVKNINSLENLKVRFISNVILIALLIVMITESTSEYFYVVAFFTIVSHIADEKTALNRFMKKEIL